MNQTPTRQKRRRKTIEKDASRCFEKSDWITLVILVTIIFIPIINIITYGSFSSNNVVDWPSYYANEENENYHEYMTKNTSFTGAWRYAFPPIDVCFPYDSFIYPNECFNLTYGDVPFTIPMSFGNNISVDINVLAGRIIAVGYNDTEPFQYGYEYSFDRTTIQELYFATPLLVPFIFGFFQENLTAVWNNLDVTIYLRDSVTGKTRGWYLTNTSSNDASDYRDMTISTNNETFDAKVYDVNVAFPTSQEGILPIPDVRAIDLTRILPFALPSFELFGLPIDLDDILDLIGVPELEKLLWINDQLYGWYQWTTTADRIGVSISVNPDIMSIGNITTFTTVDPDDYVEGLPTPYFPNANISLLFMDLSMFAGRILKFEDTVLSIVVLDSLILALAGAFIIFVNYFKFPGRQEYEDLREAYKIKYEYE